MQKNSISHKCEKIHEFQTYQKTKPIKTQNLPKNLPINPHCKSLVCGAIIPRKTSFETQAIFVTIFFVKLAKQQRASGKSAGWRKLS
jgi:hypothetical protein